MHALRAAAPCACVKHTDAHVRCTQPKTPWRMPRPIPAGEECHQRVWSRQSHGVRGQCQRPLLERGLTWRTRPHRETCQPGPALTCLATARQEGQRLLWHPCRPAASTQSLFKAAPHRPPHSVLHFIKCSRRSCDRPPAPAPPSAPPTYTHAHTHLENAPQLDQPSARPPTAHTHTLPKAHLVHPPELNVQHLLQQLLMGALVDGRDALREPLEQRH